MGRRKDKASGKRRGGATGDNTDAEHSHGPETELSIILVKAAKTGELNLLQDHIEVPHDHTSFTRTGVQALLFGEG